MPDYHISKPKATLILIQGDKLYYIHLSISSATDVARGGGLRTGGMQLFNKHTHTRTHTDSHKNKMSAIIQGYQHHGFTSFFFFLPILKQLTYPRTLSQNRKQPSGFLIARHHV